MESAIQTPSPPPQPDAIALQGVRVHNLQNVSLDVPLGRLVAFCGVSGSGKSSLAFDTLYAEGQRRYIETFSPYARQFLQRMDRPDADRIEPIPPAIALRQGAAKAGSRATIATATEIHDHLRLLYARLGRVICTHCRREVRSHSPQDVLDAVQRLPEGTRLILAFPPVPPADDDSPEPPERPAALIERLLAEGFDRAIAGGATGSLRDHNFRSSIEQALTSEAAEQCESVYIIVDRLVAGRTEAGRLLDSIELAMQHGDERLVLIQMLEGADLSDPSPIQIDGKPARIDSFSRRFACAGCGREFAEPEPLLFSFSSPLGACPECHGFGAVPAISFDKLVPDPSKSLRDGAIAPWTTPAYRHELDELLALAGDYGLPVDVPFSQLQPDHLALILEGVPERNFGGLRGFFRWLERHKYKVGVRVFLSRWRAYEPCPACHGNRLQPAALAVRLPFNSLISDRKSEISNFRSQIPNLKSDELGPNIADLCRQTVSTVRQLIQSLPATLTDHQRELTRAILAELTTRLGYLDEVGLGYLTLDRPLKTLSSGEAQRVALTGTLGSHLVNMLYVLDEPSAGLHPRDSQRVIAAVRRLRDLGNTVAVVEHERAFLAATDQVIEIGPGAGAEGGRIVFQGTPEELAASDESLTGRYYSGRQTVQTANPAFRRRAGPARLRLTGASHHNLKHVDVDFPLNLLCAVTGVSGSGKSTLIEDTLYPALCRALKQPCDLPVGPHDALQGADQIDEVVLVDTSPIGRTPRSNPITYLGAFDEVRRLFAASPEAKVRQFTPTHFSFNTAAGGRCPRCEGNGSVAIDMQFLPDVAVVCPECHGTRYRREILDVKYRGLSIAEVLNLTVRAAFTFFARQPKLQKKLQLLKEIGLDYLPLGQPATTLSGGESQRLKLAAYLGSGTRARILFLLDEPTTGLHPADVARLLTGFQRLLDVGHSLIVIEHNLDLIRAADWIIDLGPEPGHHGGQLVATGPPEQIAASETSITGRYLREIV